MTPIGQIQRLKSRAGLFWAGIAHLDVPLLLSAEPLSRYRFPQPDHARAARGLAIGGLE